MALTLTFLCHHYQDSRVNLSYCTLNSINSFWRHLCGCAELFIQLLCGPGRDGHINYFLMNIESKRPNPIKDIRVCELGITTQTFWVIFFFYYRGTRTWAMHCDYWKKGGHLNQINCASYKSGPPCLLDLKKQATAGRRRLFTAYALSWRHVLTVTFLKTLRF